jgi:protein-tyrosine-phosphatase
MAVKLASKLLPGNFSFDSAGIDTNSGRAANPNAINVMQNEYGIDISKHKTKDIQTINLDKFDIIVAMDQYVFDELTSRYELKHKILYKWNIDDPFGADYQCYKNCAINIEIVISSQFL